MAKQRTSVMVIPKDGDKILLQSLSDSVGQVFWDGFGSFYQDSLDPQSVAQKVCLGYFPTSKPFHIEERATLNYLIKKPAEIVDLVVEVYFMNTDNTFQIPTVSRWFVTHEVPYTQMHQATGQWLPLLLANPGYLSAQIKLTQDGDHTSGIVTEFIASQ